MKHTAIVEEDEDNFLAAYRSTDGWYVNLISEDWPFGWPIKANTKYELTYDDETGDVDMTENLERQR